MLVNGLASVKPQDESCSKNSNKINPQNSLFDEQVCYLLKGQRSHLLQGGATALTG